jgi:hypothetical protein
MNHRFAGFNESGKVEHAVEGLSLVAGGDEKVFKSAPISQFPLHEFHSRRQQIAPSVAQIIEHYRGMSLCGKQPGDGTTYIPGTPGYQYLHKKLSFLAHFSLT